jgi:hemerythrin-like metal-binding protein
LYLPLIEWNEAFSVGAQKLDEQHRKFFSITNLLFDSMQGAQNREVVGSVLKELQQYVVYHFKAEETLLKMYNYPDINSHKLEHENAIQKVNRFTLDYERGLQTIDIDLLKFLSDWIQNHILKVDRKYISYIKGKV